MFLDGGGDFEPHSEPAGGVAAEVAAGRKNLSGAEKDIDKPIAVILIINTAAHTIGAAVAGGSLDKTFGSQYMWVFSLVFTLLMVQYTEILPKTLGVRYNCTVLKVDRKSVV